MKAFLKFSKIDEAQRMAYGVATDETVDSDGEIVDYDATREAVADWAKWANIREMHRPSAVGVAQDIQLNDLSRSLEIGVKVVDNSAWEKVKAGVYKGFSIGGRKLATVLEKRGDRQVRRIIKYLLTEISLVDRPANPSARFVLVKRSDNMSLQEIIERVSDSLNRALGLDDPDAIKGELQKVADDIAALPVESVTMAQVDAAIAAAPFAKSVDVDDIREDISIRAGDLEAIATSKAEVIEARLSEFAKADDLVAVEKSLSDLLGDLVKTIGTLEVVAQRVDTLEKHYAGVGPVLRELGTLDQIQAQREAVLKQMMEETLDPGLRQKIGQELAQLQIKQAQGRQITLQQNGQE